MIMRVPQKEVIGQRARSRRLKLRLKSKHSLRVEFIEHLNLMNLTRIGQAEINWRVRSPRLPTKGEREKHFIDGGSITRVCHWSSSHSIDEFHLLAIKGRACEKKISRRERKQWKWTWNLCYVCQKLNVKYQSQWDGFTLALADD